MSLRQLSLSGFRNIKSTTLELHPRFNLITGDNGSGKTSILESIHTICQGQSFKTTRLNECIQEDQDSFLIFGQFNDYKAGINRNSLETSIRLNEHKIHKLSLLAEKSPVRILDSSSFDLVTGKPSNKREFMDWVLFHVEHLFHDNYKNYKHALKQRNVLLRKRKNLDELPYWDDYLTQPNLVIHGQRLSFIQKLNALLKDNLNLLIDDLNIELNYIPGWDTDSELNHVLKLNRHREIKQGRTLSGIHLDNIEIYSNGVLVQKVLSRGQLKRLSLSLLLAQIILLHDSFPGRMILLVDDLIAELDSGSIDLVISTLSKLDIQVFITSIQLDTRLLQYEQEYKMFHVEHGIIQPVKNARIN